MSWIQTRIQEFRARFDLTQADLARKVVVPRETILCLEKGKYNPSLKLAYDIAKVFGTPLMKCLVSRMKGEQFSRITTISCCSLLTNI